MGNYQRKKSAGEYQDFILVVVIVNNDFFFFILVLNVSLAVNFFPWLQDPKNKSFMLCDEELQAIFSKAFYCHSFILVTMQ